MPAEGSTTRRGPGRPKGSRNKEKQSTATGSSSLGHLEGEAASSQRSVQPSQYNERPAQLFERDPRKINPMNNPSLWSNEQPAYTNEHNTDRGHTGAEGTDSEVHPNTYNPAQPDNPGYGSTQNAYPPDSRAPMDPNQPPSVDRKAQSQQESADPTQYDPKFSFNDVPWNPNYPPEQ
ncbi:hypothetical protein L204_104983 [Cryptococcus depauperatus]